MSDSYSVPKNTPYHVFISSFSSRPELTCSETRLLRSKFVILIVIDHILYLKMLVQCIFLELCGAIFGLWRHFSVNLMLLLDNIQF